EDDARALAFAKGVPDGLAECPSAGCELGHRLGVFPVGQPAPVIEILAVDGANRAELLAEVNFVVVRNHCDWPGAHLRGQLNRHRAEAARTAPDQHNIAFLDLVWRPTEE